MYSCYLVATVYGDITSCLLHCRPELAIVGFCFSFPMDQKSVNHGTLIKWNKGFTNSDSVGEDPTNMLEAALARQGMKVRLISIPQVVHCIVALLGPVLNSLVQALSTSVKAAALGEQNQNTSSAQQCIPASGGCVA